MPKPKMTASALDVAVRATESMMIPSIEELRPHWFTVSDYVQRTGMKRNKAERILRPLCEKRRCLIGQVLGWAYRIKP